MFNGLTPFLKLAGEITVRLINIKKCNRLLWGKAKLTRNPERTSVPECCQLRTPWKLPLTRETSVGASSQMAQLYKQTKLFDHGSITSFNKWLSYFGKQGSPGAYIIVRVTGEKKENRQTN